MTTRLAPLALAALLAACANQQSNKANVVAAEAELAASGRVALAYMRLPECGGTAKLCSDPNIKANIKRSYDAAYDAVTGAQAVADNGGAPDMVAVQTAVATLQAVVNVLPKGN